MAEDPAVLLNISEMIDLAIGTPECGVVDFNMLQTVLHCLAQQLRVQGKNVELRGSAANLPVGRDHVQTVLVNEYEYEIDTDKTTDKENPVMKIATSAPATKKSDEPETILIVERKRKAIPGNRQSPTRDYSPPGRAGAGGSAKAGENISQFIPHQASTEKLSLVTISKFNLLESAVEDLKNRVYGSIPKNDQILEEVRSQTNMKAITDMWTSLNVSSRLEAAEEGISKLSSLVQDLISEASGLQESLSRRPTTAEATASTLPINHPAGPTSDSLTEKPGTLPSSESQPSAGTQASAGTQPSAGAQSMSGTKPTPGIQPTSGTQPTSGMPPPSSPGLPPLSDDFGVVNQHLTKMRSDLDQLTKTFYRTIEEITGEPFVPPTSLNQRSTSRRSSVLSTDVLTRINELEKKLNKCCNSIGKNDGVIQDQIHSFQDQLEALMKQVTVLTQDLAVGKLSPDLIKDLQGLMELFSTVQEMQDQLKQVHATAMQLAAEKEDRQHNINALLEQIELLKMVKLDREDMIEAMAEKADLRMLARKVSHDQFELACDDLSRGLEHALGKLNIQEALWQQALDDIQREIEMKLDKMELSPVKDFFNSKLRQLQENLKQMASLRREAEAAGTKRKLLRDVKCISCDAKAVMAAEAPSTVPVSRPLPANFSMKPYLSYELDAIRKTQQTNVPQRNMHDWEAIDKQMGPKQLPRPKSEGDKHLCNRYCGGSHTVTTPAQRVARLGHFIKQWGPDVLPLSSGMAAGDDGRLYKVTTTEAANVGPGGTIETTCTPKPPPKESQEKSRIPPKPMVISAECRCLEGGK
ncbi:unnamed protein product [Chilo suppressalis]|uniref:DUF4795 domain-containing protein n=1 Tax=Chilo suppressalis TaxID=168631 RepID=A0ABN8B8R7_CHISP|nr:unnamed protein product [Chilo suppressalis]